MRMRNLVAPIAAIAAVTAGGVAYASSGGAAHHAQTAVITETSGPDGDNVQSGDQTTPDTGGSTSTSSDTSTETGSEVDGNDGPGGHADASANADHQFQGQE